MDEDTQPYLYLRIYFQQYKYVTVFYLTILTGAT
jgi:hypothetical protein